MMIEGKIGPTRAGMVFETDPKTGQQICVNPGREIHPLEDRIADLERALAAERQTSSLNAEGHAREIRQLHDMVEAEVEARREAEGECERLREAAAMPNPAMIAAAWGAWRVRHKDRLGPGPGFVEAIRAALAVLAPPDVPSRSET